MSEQITTAFVKQYNSTVRQLQQQMDSRLRDAVAYDGDVVGDRAFYDQVDATSMTEITNRHGDTQYTDTPHRRRMITLTPYEVADLVDRPDRRRLLADPVNPYSRAMASAVNRRIDDTILAAFDATASTGVDGAGTVAFPAAFSFSSTANLIVEDLIKGRELLEAAENMEDDGEYSWHIVCSAGNRRGLLNDTTNRLTSSDFTTIRALNTGQVDQYLGLNFHKSQRSAIDGSDVRDVYMWVKQSMQLAVSQEGRGFMDVLPQKRHSIQIRYEQDIGATRMDEKGVVRILSDET